MTPRKGQLKAEARLYALREMMLMEMPDRWSDVLLDRRAVSRTRASQRRYADLLGCDRFHGELQLGRTQLAAAICDAIAISRQTNTTTEEVHRQSRRRVPVHGHHAGLRRRRSPHAVPREQHRRHRWRRCAGVPRRLGPPDQFLRWAPGFDSQIQLNANDAGDRRSTVPTWTNAAASDHDPFDLFRADPMAFRLVPLIYSRGRDEDFGIRRCRITSRGDGVTGRQLTSAAMRRIRRDLTPYAKRRSD